MTEQQAEASQFPKVRLQGPMEFLSTWLAPQAYLVSLAIGLAITGAAKVISGIAGDSGAPVDWLIPLSSQQLFLGVGTLEILLACYLLVGRSVEWRVALALATFCTFAAYRAMSWIVGAQPGCPCGGSLVDSLPHVRSVVSWLTSALLWWGLLGSLVLICVGQDVEH